MSKDLDSFRRWAGRMAGRARLRSELGHMCDQDETQSKSYRTVITSPPETIDLGGMFSITRGEVLCYWQPDD